MPLMVYRALVICGPANRPTFTCAAADKQIVMVKAHKKSFIDGFLIALKVSIKSQSMFLLHLLVELLRAALGNGKRLPLVVFNHLAQVNNLSYMRAVMRQLPVDGVHYIQRLAADGNGFRQIGRC